MGGLFLNLGRGLRHLLQPSRSLPIPALFELVSGLSQSGRGLSCTPVLSGLVTCFFLSLSIPPSFLHTGIIWAC